MKNLDAPFIHCMPRNLCHIIYVWKSHKFYHYLMCDENCIFIHHCFDDLCVQGNIDPLMNSHTNSVLNPTNPTLWPPSYSISFVAHLWTFHNALKTILFGMSKVFSVNRSLITMMGVFLLHVYSKVCSSIALVPTILCDFPAWLPCHFFWLLL